jgi:hypothetical protein
MKIRLHQASIALAFLLLTCPSAREGIIGQAIDPNGIPDEIKACLLSKPGFQLDGNINPYYINGDYDGDGITDFAVLIRSESDRGGGIHHILFCFGSGKTVLWDAGTRPDSSSSPFTTWFLVRKQSKLLSIHPKINHDSLAILIGEEGGGLVYWDGRKLNWQMEE